jgi:threonine/homoserine/homoserine lactone efflux protein
MDLAHFLEFSAAVLVMELTPGPNMGWLAVMSASEGRRAGLAATAGIAIGLALNALLAVAGLAAVVAAEPAWQNGLRWAGVVVIWSLAAATWRAPKPGSEPGTVAAVRVRGHFAAGLVLNLFNPKAVLFFVAVVPPFLHGAPLTPGLGAGLAAVSVGIATAIHLGIVAGASRARDWFAQSGEMIRVRRGLALVMAAMGLWLALKA